MVELESEDCHDKVPDGLKISPAHFLSAPTDEGFREVIEGDKHEHHIIKINKKNGKYEAKTFGNFSRVTDKFCFETEDIREFCYITSGILGTGFGSKPHCNHGAKITFAVEHNGMGCPLEDGSLEFFIQCISKVKDGGKEKVNFLYKVSYTLDQIASYKMKILPGDEEGVIFNFLKLCQDNGQLSLGNFPSKWKKKDCKKKVTFECKLYEKSSSSDWEQCYMKFGKIDPCIHPQPCSLLVKETEEEEMNLASRLNSCVNIGGQHSNNEKHDTGSTNLVVHGNVGSIGSIRGQNPDVQINKQ